MTGVSLSETVKCAVQLTVAGRVWSGIGGRFQWNIQLALLGGITQSHFYSGISDFGTITRHSAQQKCRMFGLGEPIARPLGRYAITPGWAKA